MKRLFLVALGLLLFAGSGAGALENAPAAATARPEAQPGVVLETTSLEIDFSKHAATLVEIGAQGCLRCELMLPVIQDLAQEYRGELLVLHYDASQDVRPAAHYRIQFVPTQIFLDRNGKEFHRHAGYYSKEEIRKVLDGRGLKRSGAGN